MPPASATSGRAARAKQNITLRAKMPPFSPSSFVLLVDVFCGLLLGRGKTPPGAVMGRG